MGGIVHKKPIFVWEMSGSIPHHCKEIRVSLDTRVWIQILDYGVDFLFNHTEVLPQITAALFLHCGLELNSRVFLSVTDSDSSKGATLLHRRE